jgi:ATP-dependent DNA helicase RecG
MQHHKNPIVVLFLVKNSIEVKNLQLATFNLQLTMTLQKELHTNARYSNLLNQYGIQSIKDLLLYFPRTHEDRSNIKNLNEIITDGQTIVATRWHIIEKKISFRNRKKVYDIKFTDVRWDVGYITIFNAAFLAQQIQKDKRYIIVGKASFSFGKIVFRHPEVVETQSPDDEERSHNVGRLYPIYSELQGIKPSRFAKKIREQLPRVPELFTEPYPESFRKKYKLLDIAQSIKNLHYPDTQAHKQKAQYRIFFDRLLKIQLYSQLQKQAYQENTKLLPPWERGAGGDFLPDREIIKQIIATLPFTLTNAQKKVTKTIIENLHETKPMLRLLQGDVGSGKTVVAAIAAYYVAKKMGAQSIFMAPLEILANQHYKTLAKVLLPLGIRVWLLTGSLSKGQKDKIKEQMKAGTLDVIVGTHALIQEWVTAKNIQLAVIDEQHKFGVKQRSFFKQFDNPHILQMSATPIPRSMALAFFGEFDVSIIDEMPAGRLPIHTKIITNSQRIKSKPRILEKIHKGEKVFIVTPLIEESDKLEDVTAATQAFEETQDLFPEIRHHIGLIHGKMKPKDKDTIMHAFKEGKIKILVATTVIEVGVDIPEATIMIIKNAERFWLSQLHQLRWRIGRSDLQSHCFLQTAKKSWDTYQRLKALEDTNDGFKLAQIDLENRGAGEMLGIRQSGESDIPMEILTNIKFIELVQQAAIELLHTYPNLQWLPDLQNTLLDSEFLVA